MKTKAFDFRLLTINQFIEYLTVEKRYSPLTAKNYERDLREFCSFLQVEPQALDPSAVSASDVRAWVVDMLDHKLSARSVNRKLSALRSFYKYLLKIGKIDRDVTRSIVAPKTNKPLPVFFKEGEMAAVKQSVEQADDYESVRDSLIIEMLYETGMRRAEMVGLNDGDIDLIQRQVRVFGKRRKERIVPFGGNLAELIERYWNYREEALGAGRAVSQPFLLGSRGNRMPLNTLYNIVRARMGEISTQKKHSPHVLRHTFATTMLNNGADINTIKTLLGHASLAATQVYTHTTFDQLKEVYKKSHPRSKAGK